jgi:hypothetical protein
MLTQAEGLAPAHLQSAAEVGCFALQGLQVFPARDGWEVFAQGEDEEILGHDAEDARASLAGIAYAELHWIAANVGADVRRLHTDVRTVGVGAQRRPMGFRL